MMKTSRIVRKCAIAFWPPQNWVDQQAPMCCKLFMLKVQLRLLTATIGYLNNTEFVPFPHICLILGAIA